jgi:hypothetical protein
MSKTIAQVATRNPETFRCSRPLTLAVAAALLAFCAAFVPNASANCKTGRGNFFQPSAAAVAVAPSEAASSSLEQRSDPANSKQSSPSIVGLWYVSYSSGGQVIDQAFEQWHGDGTEILNDTSAPATDNVCLGVWQQTGTRTYQLKHPSWYFDLNGNLLGTVIIRETIRLSPDGNSFSGSSTDDAFDTAGNFLGEETATVAGKRITVN